MGFKKIRKRITDYIDNPEVDIKDRSFVIFSYTILLSLVMAIITGMLMDEPIESTISTVIGLVLFAIYVTVSVKKNKIRIARYVISFVLVFLFLPAMFFTNGGITGGTPIWILLGTFYVVLVQDKKSRIVFLISDGIIMIICYAIGYYRPDLVTEYTREDGFLDSLIALLIVGTVVFAMLVFQNRLYRRENELAMQKTKEVEEMNLSQSRFFSNMSHEIRTPINTVLGLNEIILRQDDASEEIKKDAVNIRGAGKMLLSLINDILDVSKIEAGKMDIVPVNYNVGSLVSDIVNMIWMKADEKGLEFNVDIDPSVPAELFGDEVRIKQILINILNNSVKYTREGSIGFHMECEIVDTGTAMISFSVTDTGMGIKQEALPHLFDSFKRVDEEKNRNIEGTGLGLSIVKQLVDLMGGEISVNSIYNQGSTFTVKLRQKIASDESIGNLEISGVGRGTSDSKFEHSFRAPDARILIVDDNEMNLEVERRLLEGTDMKIDLATSGEKALALTLSNRYDVIFMDHLMPEMDGLECFRGIRDQKGGLNRQVPIIVLTANAGSENIDLYNNTGFDGYLVKPVSGAELENMLIAHLPENKLRLRGGRDVLAGSINTGSGYARKRPVVVTTSSMVDIPKSVLREQRIETIPFYITTEEGRFADGVEIDSDEMARYMMDESRMVTSLAADVDEYVSFFSEQLKKAHHIIHVSLSPNASVEYQNAVEAGKSFGNVTIVNSSGFTTMTGMLALIADRMAMKNEPVDKIVEELELVKDRINCTFIMSNTDYMCRRGLIPPAINRFFKMFWLHPTISVRDDKVNVDRVLFGNLDKCFEKYIRKALSGKNRPDPDIAIITYTGMDEERLLWVEELVKKRFAFKKVILQKASAGITSNCGPGTFGIIFINKGDVDYKLGSMFKTEEEEEAEYIELRERSEGASYEEPDVWTAPEPETPNEPDKQPEKADEPKEWYETIDEIDAAMAIKNSGSKDAFVSVLEIYNETGRDKEAELKGFFEAKDWENYTIKVHALKSSSRLVGAMELGEMAEKLEMAGKSGDTDYIAANHDELMERFAALLDKFAEHLGDPEDDRPEADDFFMESMYEMLREGAEAGDDGMIDDAFAEMSGYKIPAADSALFDDLKTAFDSDGCGAVVELLDKAGK